MTAPVFKIIPTTQQYDWGKFGLSSKVAQFAAASKIPGFELDENTPYAEVCTMIRNHHMRLLELYCVVAMDGYTSLVSCPSYLWRDLGVPPGPAQGAHWRAGAYPLR